MKNLLYTVLFGVTIFFCACGSIAHCNHQYVFKGNISNPNNDSLTIEITNIGDALIGTGNVRKDKGSTTTNEFSFKGDYYTTCNTKPAVIKNSEATIEITITKNGTTLLQKKPDKSTFNIVDSDGLTFIDVGNIDFR